MPYIKPESTKRLPYRIPEQLIETLDEMAGKHIPPPTRTGFYRFILKQGLDAYEDGQRPNDPQRFMVDGDVRKAQVYYDEKEVIRFKRLSDRHEPEATRKDFLIYILTLGIEQYEREYSSYGIKRG